MLWQQGRDRRTRANQDWPKAPQQGRKKFIFSILQLMSYSQAVGTLLHVAPFLDNMLAWGKISLPRRQQPEPEFATSPDTWGSAAAVLVWSQPPAVPVLLYSCRWFCHRWLCGTLKCWLTPCLALSGGMCFGALKWSGTNFHRTCYKPDKVLTQP